MFVTRVFIINIIIIYSAKTVLYIELCFSQGWVFDTAKSIFAWTVEKTCKNHGKNWQ